MKKILLVLSFVLALVTLIILAAWVFGVAVAKGFWMTLFAFCVPFVGWVLTAQFIIERVVS